MSTLILRDEFLGKGLVVVEALDGGGTFALYVLRTPTWTARVCKSRQSGSYDRRSQSGDG